MKWMLLKVSFVFMVLRNDSAGGSQGEQYQIVNPQIFCLVKWRFKRKKQLFSQMSVSHTCCGIVPMYGGAGGPFKCYITLFFWKLDPHPPLRNANNIEHYTFITLFSRKSDTPHPHLRYVTLEWPLCIQADSRALCISDAICNVTHTSPLKTNAHGSRFELSNLHLFI